MSVRSFGEQDTLLPGPNYDKFYLDNIIALEEESNLDATKN